MSKSLALAGYLCFSSWFFAFSAFTKRVVWSTAAGQLHKKTILRAASPIKSTFEALHISKKFEVGMVQFLFLLLSFSSCPSRFGAFYIIGVHEVGKIKMRLLCIFAEKKEARLLFYSCVSFPTFNTTFWVARRVIHRCMSRVAQRLAFCRYSANTWIAFTLSFYLP